MFALNLAKIFFFKLQNVSKRYSTQCTLPHSFFKSSYYLWPFFGTFSMICILYMVLIEYEEKLIEKLIKKKKNTFAFLGAVARL